MGFCRIDVGYGMKIKLAGIFIEGGLMAVQGVALPSYTLSSLYRITVPLPMLLPQRMENVAQTVVSGAKIGKVRTKALKVGALGRQRA